MCPTSGATDTGFSPGAMHACMVPVWPHSKMSEMGKKHPSLTEVEGWFYKCNHFWMICIADSMKSLWEASKFFHVWEGCYIASPSSHLTVGIQFKWQGTLFFYPLYFPLLLLVLCLPKSLRPSAFLLATDQWAPGRGWGNENTEPRSIVGPLASCRALWEGRSKGSFAPRVLLEFPLRTHLPQHRKGFFSQVAIWVLNFTG